MDDMAGLCIRQGARLTLVYSLSQIAADNAVFGQTGPKVGSFDAGYGSTQMARLVGQKKAREIWFLARMYSAQQVKFAICSSSADATAGTQN